MGKHMGVKHGENLTRSPKAACIPRNEDIPRIRLVIARLLFVLHPASAGYQAGKGCCSTAGTQRQLPVSQDSTILLQCGSRPGHAKRAGSFGTRAHGVGGSGWLLTGTALRKLLHLLLAHFA